MSRVLFATAAFFFSLSSAYAAGNVLLPDQNSGGNNAPLPNLGLSPYVKPAPGSKTKETGLPNLGLTPAPLPAPSADSSKPKEQKLKTDAAKKTETPKKSTPQKPADIVRRDKLPGTEPDKTLPRALDVSLGENSSLSLKDLRILREKLGLENEDISSSCSLVVRGSLITDKGTYTIGDGFSAQTTVYYDGLIRNYSMAMMASCLADERNLPPSNTSILKLKNRFLVPLNPVLCPAPASKKIPVALVITYNGGRTPQCDYYTRNSD